MIARIILISLLLPAKIFAQPVLSIAGAGNEALAGQAALSRDEWSLWRNPAGLAFVDASAVSFGVRHTPIINVPAKSALVALHIKALCISTGVSAFGDELYNENVLSLGAAHRIGITNVGLRADVFQLHIDGQSTRRTFGVTIGGITSISSRLFIGVVARNINLPQWTQGQSLPVVLNAGLLFTPTGIFSAILEIEKNTGFHPTIKGAVEYSFRKKFFARTGFNLFPNAAFGGIGFRAWRFGFDYAIRWGYLPGYFHTISVSIKAKRK